MSTCRVTACIWISLALAAQPWQRERLGRGVVAVRATEQNVFVSWRLLQTDPPGVAFNVYRGSDPEGLVRLNDAPLSHATNWVDETFNPAAINFYSVRPVVDWREGETSTHFQLQADAPVRQYLSVPLWMPEPGVAPDNSAYTYNVNDGSAGDLDGDEEYELVVKWDPSNAKDNSQSGYTGNVYLDAYRLDGTLLWRIDLGRNIRAGAHYTQFLVYDFDGDGRAEIACKTAPGTRDGTGQYVATAPERFYGTLPRVDHEADYRSGSGYVLTGFEFFTIFDGQTGAELASTFYDPPRNDEPASANVSAWGDNYGNRVDRFLAAVAYLDGVRPSLVFCRGYYTRAVLSAWNWRDGKLSKVWTFDSDDGTPGNAAYRGAGNHNLAVADLDNDGKDEIVYGSAAIDHDGKGMYASGRGHGDALHVAPMDPARTGIQAFQPHESPSQYGASGLDYRDALTGTVLCGAPGKGDIGRGVAFDIDPRFPGFEFWGAGDGNLYNVQNCDPDPEQGPRARPVSAHRPSQMNFGVWWDGDLLRELLDGTTISKWDWTAETVVTLLKPPGVASNNGTKATPVLSAELFGDWREEVVWRSADNQELRIFTTVAPTEYRLPTLMHDRQYRLGVAWQNTGYNQPPHPGFYLGEGMRLP